MASKIGAKKTRFKLQRGLLAELPGLGKAGAMERRAYPPGQHGHRRRKLSEYALRLREKQKLKFHYVLREEQLKRLAKRAKMKGSGDWMHDLIVQLESRLDNVVFRMGWARSILAARQLVSHGHVLVNGKRVNIGSYVLTKGDTLTLGEKLKSNNSVLYALQESRLPLPEFLDRAEDNASGVLTALPSYRDIPFEFDSKTVTEFFSKLK
jgi:small subunit ribosomal protein S4